MIFVGYSVKLSLFAPSIKRALRTANRDVSRFHEDALSSMYTVFSGKAFNYPPGEEKICGFRIWLGRLAQNSSRVEFRAVLVDWFKPLPVTELGASYEHCLTDIVLCAKASDVGPFGK